MPARRARAVPLEVAVGALETFEIVDGVARHAATRPRQRDHGVRLVGRQAGTEPSEVGSRRRDHQPAQFGLEIVSAERGRIAAGHLDRQQRLGHVAGDERRRTVEDVAVDRGLELRQGIGGRVRPDPDRGIGEDRVGQAARADPGVDLDRDPARGRRARVIGGRWIGGEDGGAARRQGQGQREQDRGAVQPGSGSVNVPSSLPRDWVVAPDWGPGSKVGTTDSPTRGRTDGRGHEVPSWFRAPSADLGGL